MIFLDFYLLHFPQGHQPVAGQHTDPRDPGLSRECARREGPEEALQPGAKESPSG